MSAQQVSYKKGMKNSIQLFALWKYGRIKKTLGSCIELYNIGS